MALFDHRTREDEEIIGSDAATRALSVTVVENDFVERVYEKISSVYDYTYGPTLHPGRVEAIQKLGIRPGERVLEVGVGTGINAALYPRDCSVTGIDFSAKMLKKASKRIAHKGISNVRLIEMDAADLKFADDTFDIVYAPYVISVVPDPVAVAREMRRVCRPGGRIVFLNHFRSPNPIARSGRARHLAVHRAHRVQVGSGSAGVHYPDQHEADFDRAGQRSKDLVARHLRQGLTVRRSSPTIWAAPWFSRRAWPLPGDRKLGAGPRGRIVCDNPPYVVERSPIQMADGAAGEPLTEDRHFPVVQHDVGLESFVGQAVEGGVQHVGTDFGVTNCDSTAVVPQASGVLHRQEHGACWRDLRKSVPSVSVSTFGNVKLRDLMIFGEVHFPLSHKNQDGNEHGGKNHAASLLARGQRVAGTSESACRQNEKDRKPRQHKP